MNTLNAIHNGTTGFQPAPDHERNPPGNRADRRSLPCRAPGSVLAIACLLAVPICVSAGNVNGALDVRLELISGCDLSLSGPPSGAVDGAALLDFGKSDGLPRLEADATAPDGRAWLRIACSRDLSGPNSPALAIDAGLHAATGQRYMAGPRGERIGYALYADHAMKTPWLPSVPLQLAIPPDGVADVLLQGRALIPQEPREGHYTDTVFLTLIY